MKLFGNTGSGTRLESDKPRLFKHPVFKRPVLISVIAAGAVALVVSVILLVQGLFKAPDIPDITQPPENTEETDYSYTMPAFSEPEFHPDDISIGGGMIAPEGFTNEDRKLDFYTVLIVGKDQGSNTDTIMVASYSIGSHEVNVVSIPRDSKVNVKRGLKKINSAYSAGMLGGGSEDGGIAQLKREVKTIIGFEPDKYIMIDLEAFVKIVDVMGGITVDVPFHMLLNDPKQDLYIDIPAGEGVELNGEDALKFARFRNGVDEKGRRKAISDYDRIKNQQTVIKALAERVFTAEGLAKIPDLINIAAESVYTDMIPENIAWYAWQLSDIASTDKLNFFTLPTNGTSGAPDWYEYLDKNKVLELVNQRLNPYNVEIGPNDIDIATGD